MIFCIEINEATTVNTWHNDMCEKSFFFEVVI